MNKISDLEVLINNKNWQKICVGEDYSNKAFKFVLNEIFKRPIAYHRKQWEFVVIFINLVINNKLNKNSVGASFGAGKEALIYDLLPYTKSFLATDLYSLTTGWNTARLEKKDSPESFLKKNAPKSLDLSNLTAVDMDMRQLDIADNSLDFCYSSCAIEHIGDREDFIQHLKEVKRVLKDDGIYVVTTELAFTDKTIAVKGNYKFNIEYLRKLFTEAGLDTLAEFDGECEKSRINAPRPYLQPLVGGDNLDKLLPLFIMWELEGIAYTSCCFVLSPTKNKIANTFIESGLDSSSKYINHRVKTNMQNLYLDKCSLDPFASLKKKDRVYLDDHLQYRIIEYAEKKPITLTNPKFCFTKFIWFDSNSILFSITYNIKHYNGKIHWYLISKDRLQNTNRQDINKTIVEINSETGFQQLDIELHAEKNKVYALIGQIDQEGFNLKNKLIIDYIDVTGKILQLN